MRRDARLDRASPQAPLAGTRSRTVRDVEAMAEWTVLMRRWFLVFLFPLAVQAEDFVVPAAVGGEDFAPLQQASPFLRSLDLSQTMQLTGIARIDGDLVATLRDRETSKTHIVSGVVNDKGWRMVAVEGEQANLETVTAQIAMSTGETFAVRFDEQQLHPTELKMPGSKGSSQGSQNGNGEKPRYSSFREGVSGDGFRGPPPPELVKKLEKLNEATRDQLIQKIGEIRERGNVGSEERQKIFTRMVDDALQRQR